MLPQVTQYLGFVAVEPASPLPMLQASDGVKFQSIISCPATVLSDGVKLRVPPGENRLQHKNRGDKRGASMTWEIYRPHVGTTVELLTGTPD